MSSKEDLWDKETLWEELPEGVAVPIYLCDHCRSIAFYWTDDMLKRPCSTEEEFNTYYE